MGSTIVHEQHRTGIQSTKARHVLHHARKIRLKENWARQSSRERERETDGRTDGQRDGQRDRDGRTDGRSRRQRERETETDRAGGRERDRERQRETERQRRDGETDKETDRQNLYIINEDDSRLQCCSRCHNIFFRMLASSFLHQAFCNYYVCSSTKAYF